MLLQSSPLFNSVVEWNLRVVVCHSFAVKRPDRTSALAQVKKTAARVLCIFTSLACLCSVGYVAPHSSFQVHLEAMRVLEEAVKSLEVHCWTCVEIACYRACPKPRVGGPTRVLRSSLEANYFLDLNQSTGFTLIRLPVNWFCPALLRTFQRRSKSDIFTRARKPLQSGSMCGCMATCVVGNASYGVAPCGFCRFLRVQVCIVCVAATLELLLIL